MDLRKCEGERGNLEVPAVNVFFKLRFSLVKLRPFFWFSVSKTTSFFILRYKIIDYFVFIDASRAVPLSRLFCSQSKPFCS